MNKTLIIMAMLAVMPAMTLADYYSTSFEQSEGFVGDLDLPATGWTAPWGGARATISTFAPVVTDGTQAAHINAYVGMGGKAVHNLTTDGSAITEPFKVSVDMAWGGPVSPYAAVAIQNSGSDWGGVWFGYMQDPADVEKVRLMYRDNLGFNVLSDTVSPGDSEMFHFDVTIDPVASTYDIVVSDLAGNLVAGATSINTRFGETFFNTIVPIIEASPADARHSLLLDSLSITAVPEPATLTALGIGLVGTLLRKRR